MSSEERAEERWENEGGATASWLSDKWGGLSGLNEG